MDSDATLIFSHGPISGGTKLTWDFATETGKPCKHIDLDETSEAAALEEIGKWIEPLDISILNVAGPRASGDPKIYEAVFRVIHRFLAFR